MNWLSPCFSVFAAARGSTAQGVMVLKFRVCHLSSVAEYVICIC